MEQAQDIEKTQAESEKKIEELNEEDKEPQ